MAQGELRGEGENLSVEKQSPKEKGRLEREEDRGSLF
jgi:hypothetical protein